MGWVSEIKERIRTTQQSSTISYGYLTDYAQRAYGRLINVMLEVEGSSEKVVEKLIRSGVPRRLDIGEQSPAPYINTPKPTASE